MRTIPWVPRLLLVLLGVITGGLGAILMELARRWWGCP